MACLKIPSSDVLIGVVFNRIFLPGAGPFIIYRLVGHSLISESLSIFKLEVFTKGAILDFALVHLSEVSIGL
jgi:hypothetical protein